MKRKPVFSALLAGALVCGASQADALDLPFKNQKEREAAIEQLLKDDDFARQYTARLLQNQQERIEKALKSGMIEGGSGGMAKEEAKAPEPEGKKATASENMTSAGDLNKAARVVLPDAAKAPDAKGVNFFLSLSCSHCRDFWNRVRDDKIVRQYLLDGEPQIRIIPGSPEDAGVIIIYEAVNRKSPADAQDFISWYFSEGQYNSAGELFNKANQWLEARKLPTMLDIHADPALLESIGKKIQGDIALDQKLGASYPSLFVDGVSDREYFTKKREEILKNGGK